MSNRQSSTTKPNRTASTTRRLSKAIVTGAAPSSPVPVYYIGGDVSKGYVDICITDGKGAIIRSDRYDDTAEGQEALSQAIAGLPRTSCKNPSAPGPNRQKSTPSVSANEPSFVVGVESSGGLERNWVRFFRNLGPNFTIHVLNGLAVKCFLSRNLHRSTTDAISAKGIANYLCSGMRPGDLRPAPAPSGDLVLYRTHCQTRRMVAKMKNQLQCILPSIHPGLVQFCREGIPQWVLLLLQRYPTAAHLARARAKTVAKIPYITPQRAQELIDDAKVSTAALDDASAAEAAKYLTGLITMVEPQVEAVKEKLLKSLRDQPDFAILTSIPGIGEVTAVTLMMEVGNFDRFHSANALVAFAGLDSSIEQSGDGIRYKSISKRGRSEIRAMLYMAAKSAYRCNPVIAEFYQRLTTQHDPRKLAKTHNQALVACMAKLLRIAYACVLSQKHFDPDHLAKLRECARSTEVDQEASTQSSPEVQPVLEVQAVLVVQASPEVQPRGVTTQNRTSCPRKRNPSPHASSLNAPVSGRESRRRRRSLAELQAQ